jgi:predicted ATP-binding protein involved in virulence
MVKEYELRADLDSVAMKMHDYDPNPITWTNWIKYLLEQLENQSQDSNSANQQRYVEMIAHLKDAIHSRQTTGGW